MASLIPGYEYDVFISYRQKDNKYDGWVTEFVENLKKELEATFKEDISVYFDINPHDGLLETHEVDESLKEKLKCLIFIPIISRTYCDTLSYAWENEFKPFVELASNDQFGLKVRLPGGNTASRVLPVRIHDLDEEDRKLVEGVLGGFLRGIEFIYKEPGVNRPLRFNEENPHDNLNHTIYRNQINKVALAIREIIESMRLYASSIRSGQENNQIRENNWGDETSIIELVEKDRIESTKKIRSEENGPEEGRKIHFLRKSRIWISGILLAVVVSGLLIVFLVRHSRTKWAKEKTLTEIERLIRNEEYSAAYDLVRKSEKYLAKDPEFRELSMMVTYRLTILTDPPGADVYFTEYADTEGEWKKLGRTPVDSVKIPGLSWPPSFYKFKIVNPGYEDILAVTFTREDTLFRKLFTESTIPEDMVYVEGHPGEVTGKSYEEGQGFFIDRNEVTNRQYKEFIDKGGYSNPDYWKNEFKKDGRIISREEAMALFVDNTGRPGPSTWAAGHYPEGQENYPVSGISWYEAAAYAEFAGKSLPSSIHWEIATGGSYFLDYLFFSRIILKSNFDNKGSEPVGKRQGITWCGAFDMAGNVREWCWNEAPAGHVIRGGAWDDPSYSFFELNQAPSFDRSPRNGFRCAKYIDKEKITENAFQPIEFRGKRNFSEEKPVSDDIFTVYRNQFLYDSTDLKAVIEERDTSNNDWIIEKITFNSAYGRERVIAYLFLPRNATPPFQTLIYWHGMNAVFEKELLKTGWKPHFDFLLKNGRAIMFPVYKGTFERKDEEELPVSSGHQYVDWVIKMVKDFRRSVDYLETRQDIDMDKIGFYGVSWGGMMGAIVPAVEDRLKVNILVIPGLWGVSLPETDELNYLPRVKIPTLMLNGIYDYRFPLENNIKSFYKLLGTPENDKKLIPYETDHYVPGNEMIKEVLAWCDKYLGPVSQ